MHPRSSSCFLWLFMSAALLLSCAKPARAWLGRPFAVTARTRRSTALRMMSTTTDTLLQGKKLLSIPDAIQAHATPGVQFLDGSWFLKDRNGRAEYEAGPRIEGAHYFDIDDVASREDLNPKGLPHMMPPANLFASAMDAMGVSNDDHLVVYASEGCMMVHRALFQIQAHGHDRNKIHLLDGTLAEWQAAGGKVDTEPATAIRVQAKEISQYTATGPNQVVDLNEVQRIIKEETDDIIVDVRSQDRFLGQVEEPRPGLRLGHMPGAKNLFFYTLLDPENGGRLKPKDEMAALIQAAGIDIETPNRIVISCGSGATACALAAALDVCGRDPSKTFVYDGSWSEWGAEKDTPIV